LAAWVNSGKVERAAVFVSEAKSAVVYRYRMALVAVRLWEEQERQAFPFDKFSPRAYQYNRTYQRAKAGQVRDCAADCNLR
jgi:hypothetical protein